MIELIQGFNIGSPLPIDGRILLSKAEMKSIDDNIMPDRYFAICESTDEDNGKLYLYSKDRTPNTETGRFIKAVPEKTSEIINDGNGEETSEGFDKFDTIASVDEKVASLKEDIENNFIDENELVAALDSTRNGGPYSKVIDTAYQLVLDSDTSEWSYSIHIQNRNGQDLGAPISFDLPVESLVIDVEYDEEAKDLIITLQNGKEIRIELDSIINGLVNDTTFNAHVNKVYEPDSIDPDANVGHLHITGTQGSAWDSKYDLPAGGIPESDLKQSVRDSLGLANTSIQPNDNISELENDLGYLVSGNIKAGDNITLNKEDNDVTINAKDTTYTAGPGIVITNEQSTSYGPNVIIAEANAPDWTQIRYEDGSGNAVYPLQNNQLRNLLFDSSDEVPVNQTGIITDLRSDIDATINSLSVVARTGEYDDLLNRPIYTSDLVNDGESSEGTPFATEAYVDQYGGKIDSISINGSTLTIDQDKNVDIPLASSSTNGALSSSDKNKLDGIESGAQVNIIESVSVNGTDIQPDNKNVEIFVPTKTSDLINDGESSEGTSFATVADVDDLSDRVDIISALLPDSSESSDDSTTLVNKAMLDQAIKDNVGNYLGLYKVNKDVTADYDPSSLVRGDVVQVKNGDYLVVLEYTNSSSNYYLRKYDETSNTWSYNLLSNSPVLTPSEIQAITSGVTASRLSGIEDNISLVEDDVADIQGALYNQDGISERLDRIEGFGVKAQGQQNLGGFYTKQFKATGNNSGVLNLYYNASSSTDNLISIGGGNDYISVFTNASVASNTPNISIDHKDYTATNFGPAGQSSSDTSIDVSPADEGANIGKFNLSVPYISRDSGGHIADTSKTMTYTVDLSSFNTKIDNVDTKIDNVAESRTITLNSGQWTSDSEGTIYTQAITINGITGDSTPIVALNLSNTEVSELETVKAGWSLIYKALTTENTITFYATGAPTVNVPLIVKGY